jgi:hypothetical protein
MSASIKLAQYRGEALHAVSQLGLSEDGEALAAITELATRHLLFAVEALHARLVKSQVIELIYQTNPTVDSGQAGEQLMKRLASGQPETQASMAALIGKIRSAIVPARAAIDRSLNMVTLDQTTQSASEARVVPPLATAGSTTTDTADQSFDLAARAKDDGKYEKMLDKLRGLSGDVSPPDGWQERVIRAAHLKKTVDSVKVTELSCYAVGDRVSFLRRRQTEDLWKLGTVTRVESWLRQDGTVGHRIEVTEWLDTIGTLRYGVWIYEDGDESTLRFSTALHETRP